MTFNQWIDECSSTNALLKESANTQNLSHGTWLAARRQSSGRGRLGRKWVSEDGNLYFSLLIRELFPALWTWVPLATACALSRCLMARFTDLDLNIKWPNDLQVHGKKLGGILCESGDLSRAPFLIVGVGLNVNAIPDVEDRPVTSLANETGQGTIELSSLLDEVRVEIISEVESLQKTGITRVKNAYDKYSVFQTGDRVQWKDKAVIRSGIIEGLGPYSDLIVILLNGEKISLTADDVSLVAD